MRQFISILFVAFNIAYASDTTTTIEKVGFSVQYADGWSAHTDFSRDLSVSGAHISGGNEVFVHMTKDTASPELWHALLLRATVVLKLEPINLTPDPNPVYRIHITLSSNAELLYETPLNTPYQNPALENLRKLIKTNERIYNNQEGKGWIVP